MRAEKPKYVVLALPANREVLYRGRSMLTAAPNSQRLPKATTSLD
jgi:hypothetical protein